MSDENTKTAVLIPPSADIPVKRSLIEAMAGAFDMEADKFLMAIQQVVFPAKDANGNAPTQAQMIAFLAVCHQYKLNPFIRQLWPFPMKTGGFQPAMAYDGWLDKMNGHPAYDGDTYEEIRDEKTGALIAGKVMIFRKDRPNHPIIKICVFNEWKRETPTWKNQPSHMLELRTYCQGIRKAFGISGIYDPDELERMEEKNITGQSVELERSTERGKEELKKTIEAKKQAAAAAKPTAPTPQPAATTAPQAPAPAPTPTAPVATPQAPAPTVVEPAATPAPVVLCNETQRKEFVDAAVAKATLLKVDEAGAKKKMKEIIHAAGGTKFAEVPAAKFPDLMKAIEDWKV